MECGPTVEQFIHAAREVLRVHGFFVDNLWHVDDVHFLCEQRGWPALNHEEAKGVFAIFNEMFEGEGGLTWEKLEQSTRIFLAQQGRIKQMLPNTQETAA